MKHIEEIVQTYKKTFRGWKEAFIFLLASLLAFIFAVTVPYYSFVLETLTYYRYDIPQLSLDLLANLYLTGGTTAVVLTLLFSVLTGVLSANISIAVKEKSLRSSGYMTGALPGFIAGGCAACGASLIPLIGLGAASIIFPFSGNLWRLGAVLILLYSIIKIGQNTEICKV